MELSTTLLLISIGVATANLIFGLIRTYYAKYAKKTYEGSVKYWRSWKERKYDIAIEVLKEIGIDSPAEFKELMEKIKLTGRRRKDLGRRRV